MKYLLIDQWEKYVPTQSDKLEMIEQRVEDSIRDVLKLIENGYRNELPRSKLRGI
jgi:hypothetical protein